MERYTPFFPTLDVRYADDHLAIVDKPSGMLSVPGKGPSKADCVPWRLRRLIPAAAGPLTIHRLDMDTSGLLVLGLTPDAQRAVSRQFEQRSIAKRYTALVEGHMPDHPDEGAIDFPMRLDLDNRPMQIHDPEQGRRALTRYRVLRRTAYDGRDAALIDFEPVTGRSHQLRVHAAHERGLHAPILGDVLYGNEHAAPHLMLHARLLGLDHPVTGVRLTFESPPPFASPIEEVP